MPEKLLTASECAAVKGVSKQAIIKAINRGEIPAQRVGRQYSITETDCQNYEPMPARQESGRRAAATRLEKTESEENHDG